MLETKEMMFGTDDPFSYAVCARCGCLSLRDPPADLSKYYPNQYYSLEAKQGGRRLVRDSAYFALFRLPMPPSVIRSLTSLFSASPIVRILILREAVRLIGRPAGEISVLDIGGGSGNVLRALRSVGFHRLICVDPYLPGDLTLPSGVRLQKGRVEDVQGRFDLVMLDHSLEHVPQPRAVLKAVHRRMNPSGVLVIRTPLADSLAFRIYREHWVQLDAPRHLHVFTVEGIRQLAVDAHFELVETIYDSTDFQFWGSELYKRGIPLAVSVPRGGSCAGGERRVPGYTPVRASELNALGEGDQAAFLLRPSPRPPGFGDT